ncbi:ATP-binding cassette domain-containing protein [Mycolicibacterium sediminis]|uniref:Thiol reductant ABC exporter subunit CydC n=1 Tax=Mycolicibacterium sediminis TaxID=1286180 RepID=A0A7I7QU22_9MYCO|nr:ATP-binding cassette domain-containing protein [Mycolicibacterium sediminis]BBY29824.1 thiol reductant ABC exporter subunit CydC [Mycolicibacterium sediminis]
MSTDTVAGAVALLRPRVPRLLAAIALGVLSLGSALALAGVAAWLVARAWEMPPILDLSVAVVAVRALGISRGLLGYCERLATHDTALRAAGRARTETFRRLTAAPTESVMRWHGGELVSRLGGSVDELSDVLVRAVLPIAVAAVLSVGAVVAVAVISPLAGAVLAAGLVVAGIVAPWAAARAASAEEFGAADARSERDTAAMTALDHAAELRVAGRLDLVIADTARRQRAWGAAADRAARPAAAAVAMPTLAIGMSVLGAVVAAVSLASTLSPTTAAILMLLPLSAFEATTALPGAGVQLTRARVALDRLTGLTARQGGRTRPAVDPPHVDPGSRLAVVGPSGSGKTTWLMAMAERQGPPITGFFPEDAHLFDTTVRDNLLVARGDASDDELLDALDDVGLDAWRRGLPDGLDTVLTGGTAAVSAGQRRRLLLARALVSDFPVVLLDEPTEHLDAADAERLLTEMLTPGAMFDAARTVVVATHQLPDAVGCPVVRVDSGGYPRQA